MAGRSSSIGANGRRGGSVVRGHIEVADRPYVLSFRGGGNYVLHSEEVRRLTLSPMHHLAGAALGVLKASAHAGMLAPD
jgi:hypothetical protein